MRSGWLLRAPAASGKSVTTGVDATGVTRAHGHPEGARRKGAARYRYLAEQETTAHHGRYDLVCLRKTSGVPLAGLVAPSIARESPSTAADCRTVPRGLRSAQSTASRLHQSQPIVLLLNEVTLQSGAREMTPSQ
jgi:hypothetical protein